MNRNLRIAIEAAVDAGKEILKIYESPVIEVEEKSDNSPLTAADKAANDIINKYLRNTDYPIISEENKQTDFSVRKNWNTFWMVDPLDGTKEFIKRNGEFTVNIALCQEGNPILGVIYVPVTRALYYADINLQKSFKIFLGHDHAIDAGLDDDKNRIFPNDNGVTELLRVVGSRSHMNQETTEFIDQSKLNFKKIEIISRGSSLKFCLVAEGEADVYPRFAPTMEWDTAAGHAICSAVGIKVISQETQKELVYNKENLLNPYFLVGK
jgi:3'(2'), 5'-bisphosphate nucleotidase